MNQPKKGTLYCVSTGPGDPELMTLKAVRITSACPVAALSVDGTRRDKEHMENGSEAGLKENCVAYQIAAPVVPGLDEKEFLYLSMPMTKDRELIERSHREAAEAILSCLREGKDVAWLTLGDVTVYATSMYVAELVKKAGYPMEAVSGVPSFCAAAARLGRSLVSGSQELHVIPSSYHIEGALDYPGTRVFMKAGSRIGQVKEQLRERGCQVYGVERCGMPGERIFTSADELDGESGYYTVLIAEPQAPGIDI